MEIKMAEMQQNSSAVTSTSTKNNGGSIIAGGTNPSRNLVYVLYHNLTDHTTKSGDFCTTTISRVN
jgi:hypothetical protein